MLFYVCQCFFLIFEILIAFFFFYVAFLQHSWYITFKKGGERCVEVYERIRERRKKLGLSANDVAEALGVSRATVYRYESADIEKLPTTIIEPLAKILRCSIPYLMGWEDELESHKKDDFVLSDLEKEIVKKFRTLNNSERAMFLRSLGIEEKRDEEKMA